METVTYQYLQDATPVYIITACDESDRCPHCGGQYKVGMIRCEWCRAPVMGSYGTQATTQ